jgi:hypothetical protein
MKPDTANQHSHQNDDGMNKPKKNARRYVWIILTLSAMLWFAPNIYFKKSLQFSKVELQSGSISQVDYESNILSNRRYFLACKIGSSILLLASILYLVSQLEIRRSPSSTQGARKSSNSDI